MDVSKSLSNESNTVELQIRIIENPETGILVATIADIPAIISQGRSFEQLFKHLGKAYSKYQKFLKRKSEGNNTPTL